MADGDNLSAIDGLYGRLRSQVEHENNLYNQRIVWLITMQAFLFATIGFLLQAKVAEHGETYQDQIDAFTALVCFLGVGVALIAGKILTNSRKALRHLGKVWDKQAANLTGDMADFYPHVSGGDGKAASAIFLRSGNLPALFALSWLVGATILLSHRFSLPMPDITSWISRPAN